MYYLLRKFMPKSHVEVQDNMGTNVQTVIWKVVQVAQEAQVAAFHSKVGVQ